MWKDTPCMRARSPDWWSGCPRGTGAGLVLCRDYVIGPRRHFLPVVHLASITKVATVALAIFVGGTRHRAPRPLHGRFRPHLAQSSPAPVLFAFGRSRGIQTCRPRSPPCARGCIASISSWPIQTSSLQSNTAAHGLRRAFGLALARASSLSGRVCWSISFSQ